MKNYETERLILKPADLEDADFFLKLYNLPSFIKFIGDRNLRTKDDAEKYIQNRFRPQLERLGFGNYVVIHKELNEKIGAVGIFEREGLDVLDIGFSFFPEFEGKGYAYESASNLKEIAKTDFGVSKLSAITSKENYSSQKLIEKLGLKFQKFVTLPDETEELMYYEN
ncbi:GNAT family N-acetyltransferase [Chryseobacterium sp. FH1]|uniref:GNAT family N-acetyltransferase n=1 Tax=Chryseobacterium sp. FH1 TaxID=1233951 RepID=UPI0004E454BE|nr:GNAT family N-acetyltransferase [Chryseobacterium sp. FH1]KFC24427.1 GNAT family acetyltransferase [Chryseobacterium sp. FH1]